MSQQFDLYRHSDAGMALAYRQAADAARRNPFETPSQAEKRAAYYERQAAECEARR